MPRGWGRGVGLVLMPNHVHPGSCAIDRDVLRRALERVHRHCACVIQAAA
jgi:hypothetical protein